jgi:hypothetical protein
MVLLTLHHMLHIADVYNPGQGTNPPGGDKIQLILQWAARIALLACVGGFIYTGGKLAIAHNQGYGGSQHTGQLGWTCAGCILIGVASGIVSLLI